MGIAHYESGGIAIARAIRAAYDLNPKLCLFCLGPIAVRPGAGPADAKRNDFCSRSCAAKRNNALRAQRRGFLHTTRGVCETCGAPTGRRPQDARFCAPCRTARVAKPQRIKADTPHPVIRGHARKAIAATTCAACGYDKCVEVCHRRPVADFPPTATLAEINAPSNLVGLCPNCHWEFDHGMLVLPPTETV